ncbi:hypothetical protein CERSUDRAFT_127436 [Gelatoporia subvermispora B]|uniref:Uncharacterized protein n=1 Tax=Ceriporiopsis subvermispora (strain B) TaxID=914234 RepID=M2QZQ2_CERS8|nr:hypothetical protein CERSUDRAFT_127436 [Gelatoporia subvermispora B]
MAEHAENCSSPSPTGLALAVQLLPNSTRIADPALALTSARCNKCRAVLTTAYGSEGCAKCRKKNRERRKMKKWSYQVWDIAEESSEGGVEPETSSGKRKLPPQDVARMQIPKGMLRDGTEYQTREAVTEVLKAALAKFQEAGERIEFNGFFTEVSRQSDPFDHRGVEQVAKELGVIIQPMQRTRLGHNCYTSYRNLFLLVWREASH